MKKSYGVFFTPLIILALAAGIPMLLGGLRLAFYQPPKATTTFPIWGWFLVGIGALVLMKMMSGQRSPAPRY